MTAPYNPDECAKLVREAREDDNEYRTRDGIRYTTSVMAARQREREHRLADQLEAARAEIEHWREARRVAVEAGEILKSELDRMRPVVDAALNSYGSQRGGQFGQPRPTDAMLELADAIDAYRASKP